MDEHELELLIHIKVKTKDPCVFAGQTLETLSRLARNRQIFEATPLHYPGKGFIGTASMAIDGDGMTSDMWISTRKEETNEG